MSSANSTSFDAGRVRPGLATLGLAPHSGSFDADGAMAATKTPPGGGRDSGGKTDGDDAEPARKKRKANESADSAEDG